MAKKVSTDSIENIEGFPVKKISNYGYTPCDFIFNYVEKPDEYLFCKSFNVFDDKWRVNIYSRKMVDGISSQYMSRSYFVKFDTFSNSITVLP